jgi:two-component system sensor histidine kinase ChvG
VKIFNRIRGPRLGTKLMMLALVLLIVPFFSYRQLVQMEQLLVQIQSQALLLLARNISTLFNGRADLFNDLPLTADQFEALYAHALDSPVRLDGVADEWPQDIKDEYLSFQAAGMSGDGDFDLLLGEREGELFAHLRVYDSTIIHRDASYLRLDNADHIRISFIPQDGDEGRVALILDETNALTGFAMDEQWRFAETGNADNRIQGRAQPFEGGLEIEIKFPLELLGSRRLFGVSWIDVDDPVDREIVGITQSLPTADKKGFNLVVLQTPEVRNIIEGLGYAGARILVIDESKRVRAETGTLQVVSENQQDQEPANPFAQAFNAVRPWIHSAVTGESYAESLDAATEDEAGEIAVTASLAGEPIALRSRLSEAQEIILAAYPVVSEDKTIGTVVVEQNIDEILAFQRGALEEVILISILSLLVILSTLVVFAGRLAWRIRNLRREASAAIDPYGRLRTNELRNEMYAADEIGDLSRSVSNMLSRLHRHNTFLENMPRTLRHEINNPLNTMSTSLQNLEQEYPDLSDNKYLDSAKRGVIRIGSIVQNLADAANLEDSLDAEDMETIDLNQLLESYVANCNLTHNGCQFVYRGPGFEVIARVSDFRIEQLLDKIIDNAVDFHRTDSPIRIQLDVSLENLQITVANRGPLLPQTVESSVFDSMVSDRGQRNKLHFGLGLYVVRVIAEHHGGYVKAMNLADSSGVAVIVQLPRLLSSTGPSLHTDNRQVSAG